MITIDFVPLADQCAPAVSPQTMAAVVRVESGYNPYAIGVVGGHLQRQPRTQAEAISTARELNKTGWNFSVGLGQVNRYNLPKYGLDLDQAFDPCTNLHAASSILTDCYTRALAQYTSQNQALQAALSCYYSGNFTRGFLPEKGGAYVYKVLAQADSEPRPIQVVPDILPPNADKTNKAQPTPLPPELPQPDIFVLPADHAPVLVPNDTAAPAPSEPPAKQSVRPQQQPDDGGAILLRPE